MIIGHIGRRHLQRAWGCKGPLMACRPLDEEPVTIEQMLALAVKRSS